MTDSIPANPLVLPRSPSDDRQLDRIERTTPERIGVTGLCLAALLVTIFARPVPLLANTAPASADLDILEKKIARALRRKDMELLDATIAEICAVGSAPAAQLIIEKCLASGRSEVEELTQAHLVELPESPAFQWLCTSCNAHKEWQVREQLVQILTHRPERAAFVALLSALYDPADGVRVGAIRALGAKDHRGSIPHLIKALEEEYDEERELGQIAGEIRDVMNRWMAQDLFGVAEFQEVWRRFKDQLLDPEIQKEKNPLGEIEWEKRGTSVAGKIPQFFGDEIVTQRVVFVMDTSISMKAVDPVPEEEPDVAKGGEAGPDGGTSVGGKGKDARKRRRDKERAPKTRLRRVQNELVRLISNLPAHFEFSIVSFDQEVSVFAKGLQKATKENKRLAIKFVRGFEVGGETWTDEAIEAAFGVSRARTIILLSDGQPYRRKEPIHVPTLLDEVDEMNRFTHVTINTVGFRATSRDAGGFLKQLAKRNQGTYTEIP